MNFQGLRGIHGVKAFLVVPNNPGPQQTDPKCYGPSEEDREQGRPIFGSLLPTGVREVQRLFLPNQQKARACSFWNLETTGKDGGPLQSIIILK